MAVFKNQFRLVAKIRDMHYVEVSLPNYTRPTSISRPAGQSVATATPNAQSLRT